MIRKHFETVKNDIAGKADLCIVSKHRTMDEIMEYYREGQRIFGENRAAELKQKAEVLPEDIEWHFIGHLQKNKVRQVVPHVSCIQSLDSLELAALIEKEAARENRVIRAFAEFHLAVDDTNKTGLSKENAVSFIRECAQYVHIDLCGIMCMGPHTEDTAKIHSVFAEGEELFRMLQKEFGSDKIRTLSMGMSDDYRIALEHSSNMVRIGTYLFEDDQ